MRHTSSPLSKAQRLTEGGYSTQMADTTKNRKTPSRQARDTRRAEERKHKNKDEDAPPAVPKNKLEEYGRKLIKWVKGETLTPRGNYGAASIPKPVEHPNDVAQTSASKHTEIDPAETYKQIEDSYALRSIEEPRLFVTALRLLTRLLHPNGKLVSFPIPELADRMTLRAANLPTDPKLLQDLVTRACRRRGEQYDAENVYADFVRCHGMTVLDHTQAWPRSHVRVYLP